MAVNFLVLFGLIEVVYRPLQYILRVPKELIDKAVELANSALGMNLMANNFTVQNDIINAVKSSPDVFSSVFSADQIASISDFNFMFLGIDLSRVPHFAFDAASLMLMIIPILSVVTMILSQIITMKMSMMNTAIITTTMTNVSADIIMNTIMSMALSAHADVITTLIMVKEKPKSMA